MVFKENIIKGSALVIWEDESKNKKRDAIDTDQITPSNFCTSECLEHIDKLWKEGAFYHLIPNFRKKVESGQNFLVAGDYFGIGSSREMSPAGLKAIGEECGKEIVIICGEKIGSIFKKNAINLGLYVIECPSAVEDVRSNDVFSFCKKMWKLTNITQKKEYKPVEIAPKERFLLDKGGIFSVSRDEFIESQNLESNVVWPDKITLKNLTLTEQIIWAHRVNKSENLEIGKPIKIYPDLIPTSDGTAPFAIYTFNKITEGFDVSPKKVAIINDHFVYTGLEKDKKQTSISASFAKKHSIKKPYFSEPGDGIFHFYLPQQKLVVPGGVYAGADSHSRAYGAYGAVGIGVGSTTAGFGWATGYILFTPTPAVRVSFKGNLQPWITGKDIALYFLKNWGKTVVQGMTIEFFDENAQLPIFYRNTIANMMAEAEVVNAIFCPDKITKKWVQKMGIKAQLHTVKPGENATYTSEITVDLSNIRPMISKPFSPDNVSLVEALLLEKVSFEKAFIGSCTNGSYEDLLQAAYVIKSLPAYRKSKVPLYIFPGSNIVKQQIQKPEPRLGNESIKSVFNNIGAIIRDSWCGPCFGQGPDALSPNEVALTTFNRNWKNRMGFGGKAYLSSPPIVAASALAGYICTPEELGVPWSNFLSQ